MTRERRNQRARKASAQANARHEAAHAVVSVRLGLPLASTDIRRRRVQRPSGKEKVILYSVGYTTLAEGTVERWEELLPDPDARAKVELLAVQIAAGLAADGWLGEKLGSVTHLDDLQQLVQIAWTLGYGESFDDPAVRKWAATAVDRAGAILLEHDDGLAWDRVAAKLARVRALSGDQVREMVQAVDRSKAEGEN